MLRQRIKHYHQWLHSAIYIKTKFGQSSPDSFSLQCPSQRTSSDLLHPVCSVKERIERVKNVKSLGFYIRLFLVPKPHQRWRPVIDLSRLNAFLLVERFKMETQESIRATLIPGEWVSSIAFDLFQVKAHDIRAFAASKAFYGGVLVDQIMQGSHWKAHNTFTNFYLKDLTWSDNDNNMYLGPVVAVQVLDPSPQTCYPRGKKGGGVPHLLQPCLQESKSQGLVIRYLISIYMVLCIKDLRLSLISF